MGNRNDSVAGSLCPAAFGTLFGCHPCLAVDISDGQCLADNTNYMFDYRSLAERGLGSARKPGLRSALTSSDLGLNRPILVFNPPQSSVESHQTVAIAVAPPVEAPSAIAQPTVEQVETESDEAVNQVASPQLETLVEPVAELSGTGLARARQPADAVAGLERKRGRRKSRVHACPVCGHKRPRMRFSSIGGRLMSRCWKCDLLTIANPLGCQYPAAHAEHLQYSMKSFWFHLRGQLSELGHRGPVGYCGPEEYSAPIAQAAQDMALVAPLEDLERYTRPGQCPAILVFHALECAPDPEALLAKCRRMLAADGRLLVAASNAKSLHCLLRPSKWTGLQQRSQQFGYGPRTLSRLFRRAGFRITRSMTSGIEVLGMSLEDVTAIKSGEKSRVTGFFEKWFRVITLWISDFRSSRSVLYVEAVPSADPRSEWHTQEATQAAAVAGRTR